MEHGNNKKSESKIEEKKIAKGKVWMWIWLVSTGVNILSWTNVLGVLRGIFSLISFLVGAVSLIIWAIKSKTGRKVLLVVVLLPIILFFIFFLVYLFLVRPHKMSGRSMAPNFQDSEYLLTEKVTYYTRNPERGDVVIFTPPISNTNEFISRVIGLPGEKVMLKSGHVYINDKMLNEPYIKDTVMTYGGTFLNDSMGYTVPTNQYFVMGDNRTASSDSRFWGPISKSVMIGRVWLTYWPRNLSGFVSKPDYNF